MNAVFVAGATGYTGREVVRIATARGARTIAHVRPDSNRLAEWAARFGQMGAEVDTTPWDARAMGETLARLSPSAVLALLGTTASRGKKAGSEGKAETYETVDYALTAILIDAARGCSPPPRFLYLSSAGVAEGTTNAYLAARVKAEAKLRASGLPYRIARPSFITGDDREEARPMERVGASLANGALSLVGALGGRRLRDRYRSTTATVLAAALVRLALDDAGESRVLESEALRA